MRAIALSRFGGPDVLELSELPDPPVGADTVLVRARAAGVNPVDAKVRAGALEHALPHHFPLVPGWDVAGVVEAVGAGVFEFAVGDEVVGYVLRDHVQHGTYAELVPAPVRTAVTRPRSVSWEEAAGLPLAGLTAWQALRAATVTDGDVLLVNAAAGGVGHLAVQIARASGARVIGTASEANFEFLRGLGAEPVAYGEGLVDAVRELAPDGVDAALDMAGGDSLTAAAQLVRDPDRLVSVIDPAAVRRTGGRYVFVRPDRNDLASLVRLVEDGRVRVEVSSTFPLERAAEAHRRIEEGHGRGKVVLTLP